MLLYDHFQQEAECPQLPLTSVGIKSAQWLTGGAQCIISIRLIMCNFRLRKLISFEAQCNVSTTHQHVAPHRVYQIWCQFFLPFSLGTCKYPLVAKPERNTFSSMYLQMWEAFQVVFAILFLAMTSIFIILHGVSWFKELSLPAVFVKRFLVWYLESQILHLNVVFSQI